MNAFQKFIARAVGITSYSDQFESGSRTSRRRGTVPGGRPADTKRDLTGGTRMEIVKRGRYADRNSGFLVEQSTLMATYAIGSGRMPQSLADDMEWRDEAERLFMDAVIRPEITGRFSWWEVQRIVSRALDRDGEIFAVKTFDLFGHRKIQLLETHAFSTKTDAKANIYDGIVFDAVGRPVAYLLEKPEGGDPIPLPANSVIHVYESDSATMARAYPAGQHGFLKIQDELEMLAMETHAVKTIQEIAMVLKSNRLKALADGDFSGDSEGDEPDTDEAEVAKTFGAKVQRINGNESLDPMQSNRPNSMFQGFLDRLEREASGGKLPWEVAGDSSKIGGASVRMVVSKADRRIQDRGAVIDQRFNLPVWGYFIGGMIDERKLRPVKGWNKVKWTSPRRITVDAGREAQANRADVEMGIKNWSEEIGERGGDFDEHFKERAAQARRIMSLAGIPESEPIPLGMLYKPMGLQITTTATIDE